jgi:hypothetical protein
MNIRQTLCCAALLGLAACGNSGGDTTGGAEPPPATSATAATTTTTTSAPLVLQVEPTLAKPGIEPRVKAEVDKRTDGLTGAAFAVAGARGSLQSPTGWTAAKGDVTVHTAPDKKAQLAGASFGTEGVPGKLPAVVGALGLTGCEWNGEEALAVGKGGVAGSGADGVCTRGAAKIRTAYVALPGDGLLVMGAWEDGGDSASIFGSMRSIVKAAGGAGNDGIAACCAALQQNAASAPLDQKPMLLQAAAICNGLRNSPQGKQALGAVRAALRGANMPSSCR